MQLLVGKTLLLMVNSLWHLVKIVFPQVQLVLLLVLHLMLQKPVLLLLVFLPRRVQRMLWPLAQRQAPLELNLFRLEQMLKHHKQPLLLLAGRQKQPVRTPLLLV